MLKFNTPLTKATVDGSVITFPSREGNCSALRLAKSLKKGCVLVILLIIPLLSQAQTLNQKLQTAFNKLQQDPQNSYASISLTVLDTKIGEVIFTANPNMGLAPASTLKTVTTVTAMHLLGADYRFKTKLSGYGSLGKDGTWNGDIIINGGDDPTLGSFRWEETKESFVLNEFVSAIKKAGIKKITGKVYAAGVNHELPGWIWQDLGNYYGAVANNLCWRENSYDIMLRPTQPGKPVEMKGTVPAIPYLRFTNQLITGADGTGDNAYATLPVNGNKVFLQGTYAIDQEKHKIAAALPDPAFEAARRLTDTLRQLGIQVDVDPASGDNQALKSNKNKETGINFTTHYSPPLRKVIYWLNQKSINLYAEQLLLAMADSLKTTDRPSVIRNFWKDKGIDKNALNITDGSGLSPGDRVTTMAMAQILKTAKNETWYPDFFASLPVYNKMHMKSGSIGGVLAYAGYQTYQGRDLCFSIIENNFSGKTSEIRQKMFKMLDEMK